MLCMNPWMLMFAYVGYDWCEANPNDFDRLPVCMNG